MTRFNFNITNFYFFPFKTEHDICLLIFRYFDDSATFWCMCVCEIYIQLLVGVSNLVILICDIKFNPTPTSSCKYIHKLFVFILSIFQMLSHSLLYRRMYGCSPHLPELSSIFGSLSTIKCTHFRLCDRTKYAKTKAHPIKISFIVN